MFTIAADRDVCIGSGNCSLVAPDVFEQDEATGLVILKTDAPGADLLEAVTAAVDQCPSGALAIHLVPDARREHPGSKDGG